MQNTILPVLGFVAAIFAKILIALSILGFILAVVQGLVHLQDMALMVRAQNLPRAEVNQT